MKLEVKKINKSFGENHVLKDLSFEAKSGSAFGLLGRNGSGKTTTIRIIMDIFRADSGEILLDEVKSSKSNYKIGYLPEERGLYPKRTISEQMIYFGELRGLKYKEAKTRSKYLLEKLDATDYYNKKLDTLSKGNQQKIQLAIALINNPDIIILDEPFSGLDPINSKILKDLVSEMVKENKLVLFSSHQMSSVEEFCDDICIINKGQSVLSGNLKTIKESYPRNKILIIPEKDNIEFFHNFIKSNDTLQNIIVSIDKKRNGIIINLKNKNDKNILLKVCADNKINFDSFSVVEPTLEEIFVEKAGDSTNESI